MEGDGGKKPFMATTAANIPDLQARGEELKKQGIVIQSYNLWKSYVMGEQTINAVSGDRHDDQARRIRRDHGTFRAPGKSTLMNLIGCLDSPSDGQ